MLNRLLGHVHGTSHGAPLLWGYLWWGICVRSVLLVALGTLLVLEGNVLAQWLLTARVPFVSPEDVEELSVLSYSVLYVVLTVGVGMRWHLLRRLDATSAAKQNASVGEGSPLP